MCSLCWNWLQCALIDLWTFVYLCYSFKSFTNKARQNCFYLPRKIISIMSVGRKFSLSCAYISKLLLRVRNRDIYACVHPHIHICMKRGEGTGMKWGKRGEERERDRKGGRGKRRRGWQARQFKCSENTLLIFYVNGHINLCIFKFLGVRSETEDQLNWMLLKLDEIFMLI